MLAHRGAPRLGGTRSHNRTAGQLSAGGSEDDDERTHPHRKCGTRRAACNSPSPVSPRRFSTMILVPASVLGFSYLTGGVAAPSILFVYIFALVHQWAIPGRELPGRYRRFRHAASGVEPRASPPSLICTPEPQRLPRIKSPLLFAFSCFLATIHVYAPARA